VQIPTSSLHRADSKIPLASASDRYRLASRWSWNSCSLVRPAGADRGCRGRPGGTRRQQGARNVDLTSRASRVAANRLYQRLGFQLRDPNVYRHHPGP
jgi:hypothetical protein